MKRKFAPSDWLFEIFALIAIIIMVQAVYATVIRPKAEAIREADLAMMMKDKNYVPELSLAVTLKDFEPEVCIIFTLWAFMVMVRKAAGVVRSRKMFETELLHLHEGIRILPEDTREYTRQIEALPPEQQQQLLPRALVSALHRFDATRNIQDVSAAARHVCEIENDRMDSELSMVRYVAWAIPAIGFVGTVRGIGESLQQAHKAVEGDVSGVVAGLGTSFNATLVALSLSILVMLMLHQLQLRQERLVLDTEAYLDEHFIRRMQVR